MSKTFKKAPKPTPSLSEEDIAAFEKGGAGTDQAAKPLTGGNAVKQEPGQRISFDLPITLHRRFKTACSATGRKMTGEITDLIKRRVSELEKEAGISS